MWKETRGKQPGSQRSGSEKTESAGNCQPLQAEVCSDNSNQINELRPVILPDILEYEIDYSSTAVSCPRNISRVSS